MSAFHLTTTAAPHGEPGVACVNADALERFIRDAQRDDAPYTIGHAAAYVGRQLAPLLDDVAPGVLLTRDRVDVALRVLIDHAAGRVTHDNAGRCPDGTTNPDARDPECTVCRALRKLGDT